MTYTDRVLWAVGLTSGVRPVEVLGDIRTHRITMARWAACALLRRRGLSYSTIGRLLNLDQSSVRYAVGQTEAYEPGTPVHIAIAAAQALLGKE